MTTRTVADDQGLFEVSLCGDVIDGVTVIGDWRAMRTQPMPDRILVELLRTAATAATPTITGRSDGSTVHELLSRNVDWKAVRAKLLEQSRALDEAEALLMQAASDERAVRRSQSERVGVVTQAGQFVDLILDNEWAAKVPAKLLSDDLNEVLKGISISATSPAAGALLKAANISAEIDSMKGLG